MLTSFYRFILVNNSGQTVTYDSNARLVLHLKGWFINPSTGKLDYTLLGPESFGFGAGDTTIDGAEDIGSIEFDNTSNLFLGTQVQLDILHDAGALADGTFDLYIARGLTTGGLPTDQIGYSSAEINGLEKVGSLIWDSSPADDDVLFSNVWEV